MSSLLTTLWDLGSRGYSIVARAAEYGTVIYNGYETVQTCREIATQEEAVTLRQKVRLVFNLAQFTSSVAIVAYQPESVIQKASQENEKCHQCVKIVSDFIERSEEQPILRGSLENCRTCVVRSASEYQSSHQILLAIRMASILMNFSSRYVENEPILSDKKFALSIWLQMLIMIDLSSKIYSDSDLKPQKHLYFFCKSMRISQKIAGIYLHILAMQQFQKRWL